MRLEYEHRGTSASQRLQDRLHAFCQFYPLVRFECDITRAVDVGIPARLVSGALDDEMMHTVGDVACIRGEEVLQVVLVGYVKLTACHKDIRERGESLIEPTTTPRLAPEATPKHRGVFFVTPFSNLISVTMGEQPAFNDAAAPSTRNIQPPPRTRQEPFGFIGGGSMKDWLVIMLVVCVGMVLLTGNFPSWLSKAPGTATNLFSGFSTTLGFLAKFLCFFLMSPVLLFYAACCHYSPGFNARFGPMALLDVGVSVFDRARLASFPKNPRQLGRATQVSEDINRELKPYIEEFEKKYPAMVNLMKTVSTASVDLTSAKTPEQFGLALQTLIQETTELGDDKTAILKVATQIVNGLNSKDTEAFMQLLDANRTNASLVASIAKIDCIEYLMKDIQYPEGMDAFVTFLIKNPVVFMQISDVKRIALHMEPNQWTLPDDLPTCIQRVEEFELKMAKKFKVKSEDVENVLNNSCTISELDFKSSRTIITKLKPRLLKYAVLLESLSGDDNVAESATRTATDDLLNSVIDAMKSVVRPGE